MHWVSIALIHTPPLEIHLPHLARCRLKNLQSPSKEFSSQESGVSSKSSAILWERLLAAILFALRLACPAIVTPWRYDGGCLAPLFNPLIPHITSAIYDLQSQIYNLPLPLTTNDSAA